MEWILRNEMRYEGMKWDIKEWNKILRDLIRGILSYYIGILSYYLILGYYLII
jgi:hypothetical protein